MDDSSMDARADREAYESVRCLECEAVYAKPTVGGTAHANPGCPQCGYVGWISVSVPVAALRPHRSAADLQLGRSAQSH
jgi:phage FluMu protein Com